MKLFCDVRALALPFLKLTCAVSLLMNAPRSEVPSKKLVESPPGSGSEKEVWTWALPRMLREVWRSIGSANTEPAHENVNTALIVICLSVRTGRFMCAPFL